MDVRRCCPRQRPVAPSWHPTAARPRHRPSAALLLALVLLVALWPPCARGAHDTHPPDPEGLKRLADWEAHTQRQWGVHIKELGGLGLPGGTTARQAVGKLLERKFILPPSLLKRAVGYEGSMRRLKRVLRDLRSGKRQVKLGVIGGSISWGSAVPRGADWFSLLVAHLRAAFPNANISSRNGCVPATPSSFMEACLDNHMDADVDLAFVEYATNDGTDTGNLLKQRVYERLLRKVASRPSAPAVVLVQLPTKGMAFGPDNPLKSHFHNTVEDVYGAYAAYYDMPSLSMRNAIWGLSELHHHGLNWTSFYGTHDYLHPLEPGHRAIADMAVWLLQHATLHDAMYPSAADATAADATAADATAAAAADALPPPMYPGNYEGRSRLCMHGIDFKKLVVGAEGFDMINEGNEVKQKYGMVAFKPGSKLRFAINTTRIDHPDAPTMDVQIAYLRSYEHMGKAVARCAAGCSCNETFIEASHKSQTSTIFLHRMSPSQADECVLEIEVVKDERPEFKFKVTGVMVSEYLGPDAIVFLTQERWMEHINHGEKKPYEDMKSQAAPPSSSSSSGSGSGSSSGSSGGSSSSVGGSGSGSSGQQGPTSSSKGEQRPGSGSGGSISSTPPARFARWYKHQHNQNR